MILSFCMSSVSRLNCSSKSAFFSGPSASSRCRLYQLRSLRIAVGLLTASSSG